MKKIQIFIALFSLMAWAVQAQITPRSGGNAKSASQQVSETASELPNIKGSSTAGEITVSVVSAEGNKTKGVITLTLLSQHAQSEDFRISSRGETVVDALSNQLVPQRYQIERLINSVPTKAQMIIYKAVSDAKSLLVVKMDLQVYNYTSRKSEVFPVEFRNIPVVWK